MIDLPQKIDPDCVHYTMREVARLVFGKSADWFSRNRATLTSKHGFPRPISPLGNPHWSGRALLAWIHRDQAERSTADAIASRTDVVHLVRARAKKVFAKR